MKADSFIKKKISENVSESPETIAFIHQDKKLSYSELKKLVFKLSQIYSYHNLTIKTPVLVHLSMGMNQAIIISSLLSEGLPALVLPTGIKAAEVSRIIEQYPFCALITEDSLREKLSPEVLKLDQVSLFENVTASIIRPAPASSISFSWLLYTSGSTGSPKMVMISQENLEMRTKGEVDLFKIKAHSKILNLLPFSHDLGFNQLLTSLCTGSTLEILVNKLPVEMVNKISNGGFDHITGMPQIWNHLIQVVNKTNTVINFNGVLTISGGSMALAHLLQLKEIFNKATIYKTYGQTETFRSLAETHQDRILLEHIGGVIPDVGVHLINENQELCKAGESGELFHYGAGVMNGYWQDEKSTGTKLVTFQGRPGVMTGDFFKLLDDNTYQFMGRRDDMIKHSGRRFFLGEVENCLMKSDLVQDVCVAQAEENRIILGNEKLVAFVVAKKESPALAKELKSFCAHHLEVFKVPDEFIVYEKLPLTSNHKIDRKELIKNYVRA